MSTSCRSVRAVAESDFLSISLSFSFEHLQIDIHRDTYTLSLVFGMSEAWMLETNTTLEQARTKVRIPKSHRHHASCDLSHLFNFSRSHLFPPKDSYLFCFLKVRITAGVVAVAFVSLFLLAWHLGTNADKADANKHAWQQGPRDINREISGLEFIRDSLETSCWLGGSRPDRAPGSSRLRSSRTEKVAGTGGGGGGK